MIEIAVPIVLAFLIISIMAIARYWTQIKELRNKHTAKATSESPAPTAKPTISPKKEKWKFWKVIGWIILVILIVTLITLISRYGQERKAFRGTSNYSRQTQVSPTISPPPSTPQWKIVTAMEVRYKWSEEDQGWVYIIRDMILEKGEYRIRFEKGSQPFRQETVWPNGEIEWLDIPPEGLRFRDTGTCRGREYVDILAESPVPSECLDARVMQVENQDPIYIGNIRKFNLDIDRPINIKITINTKRGPGYFHNEGGDTMYLEHLI